MFSLYHSSQKQFIILSPAVLVASNLAWSMHICLRLYIGHFLLVSALTSPSICVSRQLFLVHYHVSFMKGWSVKQCLLGESRANQDQLLLQISQSRKRKNSGTLKQFGPIFSKKWAKIKIQEQFSVLFTSQTNCLLMNMSRDVSRTRITVWLLLITLETLSFFSLKSSLEFIIITPHNMQKTRRSKERTNMDLHDNICRGSPIQFLTLPDRVFECH